MNELTHLFNFKRSVLCNQISPKHVDDTSASRSIFFAINAQIVLKFSPYVARSSPIIFHTKILPIGLKYLHKADICSPKQNCTPDRWPFHLEATCSLLPSCFAVKHYYAKGLLVGQNFQPAQCGFHSEYHRTRKYLRSGTKSLGCLRY